MAQGPASYNYNNIRAYVRGLHNRCDEVGKRGSKCLIWRDDPNSKKLATKRIPGCQGAGPHKPQQWIFFLEHGHFPELPQSVSHQCGKGLCLNGTHYLDETMKINRDERQICHRKITKWLKENKKDVICDTQYTVRDCKGIDFVCGHEHQCFISVSDAALQYF